MGQDVLITTDNSVRGRVLTVAAWAAVVDVLCVGAFVVIGRLSHDESLGATGVLGTAWPYLVGVAGGWLGIALARWHPLSLPAAGMMLVKTVILGAALRAVVQSENVPVSFVAVSVVVFGVLFFGWRMLARQLWRMPPKADSRPL